MGAANSGISKTLCNLALSFWLRKSDELPTKKILECCAKETQLSLISKIVASCFISKQNKQFGSNLPNIKTFKCDLIVNTTLQLNICKFVLHEKLIKMRGEYVRGISDLSPLRTVEPLHMHLPPWGQKKAAFVEKQFKEVSQCMDRLSAKKSGRWGARGSR